MKTKKQILREAFGFLKKYDAKKGGAGSGNFGHAGRPGEVGGSSGDGGGDVHEIKEIPGDKGAVSPSGVAANWLPEKGGVLYHGTAMSDNEEYLTADKEGVVYLTNDFNEAKGYAEGGHLGGSSGGTPRVLEVGVASGKLANIQDGIDKAVEDGVDFKDVFDGARAQGYDFAYYEHPSFTEDGVQHVIVALNPGDQLGSNNRGWNIVNNRRWARQR